MATPRALHSATGSALGRPCHSHGLAGFWEPGLTVPSEQIVPMTSAALCKKMVHVAHVYVQITPRRGLKCIIVEEGGGRKQVLDCTQSTARYRSNACGSAVDRPILYPLVS
jgi:hypothetical protein